MSVRYPSSRPSVAAVAHTPHMEIQLRDYQIRPGHMDDWIASWKRGIVPAREQAEFVILGAWVDRPNDRFVWVVGYSGADGFTAAEDRYHASSGRLGLDPNPSDFVESGTLDMVHAVPPTGAD
jgi:hypothetical protein